MRYWKRIDEEGKTTTVESYSHYLDIKGAIEITEKEFNSFISELPQVITETRDLAAEIDQLKAEIAQLKQA